MELDQRGQGNSCERSGIHSPRDREAGPQDERRRIHFAAANDTSGGSGGCAASTPQLHHDACGVGFLAELEGRPSTRLLPLALTALDRLAHRGAVDADGRTGDGSGARVGPPLSADECEAPPYRARRDAEARAPAEGFEGFHVASLSRRSLVYKALVRGVDLAEFYPDLRHPAYASAFVVFHQRFSTNTFPSWSLTQPFRMLGHNGEINTIQGNRSGMRAREAAVASPRLGLAAGELRPLLPEGGSDSASLDEALALLTLAGRDAAHAMTLLVPPAWENDSDLSPEVRAFFEYQSTLMEPWDGPALVVFTDGRLVGAALDRNGLRPARSVVTADGLVLVASEAGVLDVEDERILHRGRLGPGDIVAVDLAARRFLDREAIHRHLAARKPYAEWLRQCRVFLG